MVGSTLWLALRLCLPKSRRAVRGRRSEDRAYD
jgi:hypothetical protein